MFYQVTMNCYFEKLDEAEDFFHDGEIALPKASVINPNTENMEYSQIELLKNHHDLDPSLPCELIKHADNKPLPPV